MKQENPLISVIVPIYKVEPYLEKCIKSIINQTYKNLQIILVDDGSPDNCGKICDDYAKQDGRIEVIHQPNGGLSDARNHGITKAKGKYIGFVDGDDYIAETMYEDLCKAITLHDSDICICNFYNVENEEKILRNQYEEIKEYSRLEILKEILIDKKIQSYAWNKLYKKELFNTIKYPVGRKYEDIGTTFYIIEKCNKITVIGKPEYYYVNRKDSIINNISEKTVNDYMELILERYTYIEQNIKELKKYNQSYLAKLLITANNDIQKIKTLESKTKGNYNTLFNEVIKIFTTNKQEVSKLLTQEQINKIEKIISK